MPHASLLTGHAHHSRAARARQPGRRRGPRLAVRIPLLLDWGTGLEASWTVVANEAGAMVTASSPVEGGRRLRIINVTTGRTAVARVVSTVLPSASRANPAATQFRLALRLETFGARFWGPVYYSALEGADRAA